MDQNTLIDFPTNKNIKQIFKKFKNYTTVRALSATMVEATSARSEN